MNKRFRPVPYTCVSSLDHKALSVCRSNNLLFVYMHHTGPGCTLVLPCWWPAPYPLRPHTYFPRRTFKQIKHHLTLLSPRYMLHTRACVFITSPLFAVFAACTVYMRAHNYVDFL